MKIDWEIVMIFVLPIVLALAFVGWSPEFLSTAGMLWIGGVLLLSLHKMYESTRR